MLPVPLRRLSHSSLLLLHSCPRKYQLSKLLGRQEEDSEDLVFGTAVGYGIEQLLIGRPKEEVWLEIYFRWKRDIADYDEKTEKKKKTLWHALHALELFQQRILPTLKEDYDVAIFDGKPACELSFRVTVGPDYFYRGFVDVVLVHKRTGELLVLEVKTTASKFLTAAKYQNSGQALGYSLICDYVARHSNNVLSSSYRVLYLVYKSGVMEYEQFAFPKSHSQRAQWIKQLLIEVEKLQLYEREDWFPMHGEACDNWGRSCDFLGVCHLSDSTVLPKAVQEQEHEEEKTKFTFEVSLLELIEAQLHKHNVEEIQAS